MTIYAKTKDNKKWVVWEDDKVVRDLKWYEWLDLAYISLIERINK